MTKVEAMRATPADITAYLHRHIPITAHLGVRAVGWDGQSVHLSAPLAPNLNHRLTAFGGSLSALAILSGWTLLHLKLGEEGIVCRLVIQKSAFDYTQPVVSDFTAVCTVPPVQEWQRFLQILQRRGRARIALDARIETPQGRGGSYKGRYVALRGPEI